MGESPAIWRARAVEWTIDRPLVMGILNVTLDSFSDGGKFFDAAAAVTRAAQIVEEGADILDIGGESTRPGARPVPAEEEWRRLGPVIEAVTDEVDLPISVDTYKPQIARKAIRAGAVIVNDVCGLRDPEMIRIVANSRAGAVIMHMKGEPATMQKNPQYGDVVADVKAFLADRLAEAVSHGVATESIVVDPGFGFGKTPAQNTTLLQSLREIRALGRPVLVGASRKSFLARVHAGTAGGQLEASLAAASISVRNGADILRVHDVAETVQLVRTLGASKRTEG